MKNIIFQSFLIAISVIASNAVYSQTSNSNIADNLHFTAVARDNNNVPIANNTIYIRIEIFEGMPGASNKIYCEQTPVGTNQFGEFSLNFPNTGDPNTTFCAPATQLSDVEWETGDKWVKISFQPNGNAGAPFVDIATFQFTTVPYAFAARTAERITNFDLTGATDGQVIKYDAASGAWKPGNENIGAGQHAFVTQSANQTTDVRASQFFVSNIDELTVPATGAYLVMASIRIDNLDATDFFATLTVDKDGTALTADVVTLAEYVDDLTIATRNGTIWDVVELTAGEKLRLKLGVSGAGTNDYTLSRGKILITRLN